MTCCFPWFGLSSMRAYARLFSASATHTSKACTFRSTRSQYEIQLPSPIPIGPTTGKSDVASRDLRTRCGLVAAPGVGEAGPCVASRGPWAGVGPDRPRVDPTPTGGLPSRTHGRTARVPVGRVHTPHHIYTIFSLLACIAPRFIFLLLDALPASRTAANRDEFRVLSLFKVGKNRPSVFARVRAPPWAMFDLLVMQL
jgi:hypothetical protein